MSTGFVFVCEDEELRHEGVELPTEGDNNLLLAVLQSQFEGASGLKYRSPTSGLWRAVKIIDGVLYPPESGWGGTPYVVVKKPEIVGERVEEENGSRDMGTMRDAPRKDGGIAFSDGYKRKMEDEDGGRAAKNPRSTSPVFSHVEVRDLNTEDLIILGLEYSVNDAELKKYFEQFGEVAAAEVKKDMQTQKSRGFGFVRFFDHGLQVKVQAMAHTIKGRRVEVKHPRKSMGYAPSKLFVGCLPLRPEVDSEELREYFGQFGALTDVYVPSPYRGFGFVTYQDGDIARKVLNMSHTLRKSQLNLSIAEPRGGRPQTTPTSSPNFQYTFDPYHQQWFDPSSTYAAAVTAVAAQQNSAYGYGTPFSFQGFHRPPQPGQTYTPPRGPLPHGAAQAASFPARQGFQAAPRSRAPPPAAVRSSSPRTVGQPHYGGEQQQQQQQQQHSTEGYYGGQQAQQQKPHGEGSIPWQNY